MRIHAVCAATLLALAVTRPALAQSPPASSDAKAQAKTLYSDCLRLSRVEEYDQAAADCKQAYLLDPDPDDLYTLGQISRLANHPAEAARYYDLFLRAKGDTLSPSARAGVQKLIDEQQAEANKAAPSPVTTTGPATTTGPPTTMPPASHPVAVPPTVPPPAAPIGTVNPPAPRRPPGLPPAAPPAPPPAPSTHFYSDTLGDVLVGGGVAASIAGAVLLAMANSDISQANADMGDENRWFQLGDQASTYRWIGVPLTLAGAGLAAWGVVRWVGHHPVESSDTTVAATLLPGGASIAASGTF